MWITQFLQRFATAKVYSGSAQGHVFQCILKKKRIIAKPEIGQLCFHIHLLLISISP